MKLLLGACITKSPFLLMLDDKPIIVVKSIILSQERVLFSTKNNLSSVVISGF